MVDKLAAAIGIVFVILMINIKEQLVKAAPNVSSLGEWNGILVLVFLLIALYLYAMLSKER